MKIKFVLLFISVFLSSCSLESNNVRNKIKNVKNKENSLTQKFFSPSKFSKSKRYNELKILKNILKRKHVIFIDAGHGGKDPGAISQNGIYEKNITLNAARILKKSLSRFRNVSVYLSRNNDKYLFLRDRIRLANKFKADIFISLHADASKNINAKGISVFTLSNIASDKEAKQLAIRENKSDFTNDIEIKNQDPLIIGNLIKMFQRDTMNKSHTLSKLILNDLKEYSLYSRGHRFAGFAVLKSPQIPSVLIELGFLTNIDDEIKLKNLKYLKKLCDTISISIIKFLKINENSN